MILKAFVSDPVSLYRGIKADWQSPALIKRAELNGGVVRFPILGALNKPTQDAMETFRGVVNDMVTNGDALREAGRLVIPAVLTEAFNGIVYRAGLDWDAYQKIYTQLPFGTESVRAKNGAPNTIEYVSADGRVLDTHVFANADQAKRAVGEMGHVRDYDQRFHMNLVDVVGKKLRRFFSIPFIGMNPANVIANVSNAVFNGFTDGVPVWSVSEPFRWRNTDRIRGQMEKWFGAPDPSLRAVGTGTAFTGVTEAMTGVSHRTTTVP